MPAFGWGQHYRYSRKIVLDNVAELLELALLLDHLVTWFKKLPLWLKTIEMGFILLTTERFVFSLSYVFLSAFSMQTKVNLIIYLRQDEFEVFVGYSVQFSHSVMSDSLRPHELQHVRPHCLSPTPGVHPNPCPLSWWCHPTNSSSVVPFSSRLQSFPASGSFQMSQLFYQVAKVLEFQLQHQSFQWTPRTDLL